MSSEPFNVLFLCTGNSARSIFAEQLVDHRGRGAFRGYSAGSHPKGAVHPAAVRGPTTQVWLAFRRAFRDLEHRIEIFTSLPIRSLERLSLQERLHAIGRTRAGDPPGELRR